MDSAKTYLRNSLEGLEEVNDLASLVGAVTAEAYELADKRGHLPERIEVKANFEGSGDRKLVTLGGRTR